MYVCTYVHRFVDIAAMHTALLAIDENGLLHYFEWNNLAPYEAEPGEHAHPRAAELGLTGESVIALDASYLRASVLTTSGKVRNTAHLCVYTYVRTYIRMYSVRMCANMYSEVCYI